VDFRLADWMWASVAAVGLLGAAAFIIFVIHPGGFEGQIGWLLALMPGVIFGLPFADRVFKVAPGVEPVALWTSVVGITFLWYFALSYAAIRTYRFLARPLG
jgi:hypothetical protein